MNAFNSDAAVAAVFEACRATGATLATCHVVAGWTADALDRIARDRE